MASRGGQGARGSRWPAFAAPDPCVSPTPAPAPPSRAAARPTTSHPLWIRSPWTQARPSPPAPAAPPPPRRPSARAPQHGRRSGTRHTLLLQRAGDAKERLPRQPSRPLTSPPFELAGPLLPILPLLAVHTGDVAVHVRYTSTPVLHPLYLRFGDPHACSSFLLLICCMRPWFTCCVCSSDGVGGALPGFRRRDPTLG